MHLGPTRKPAVITVCRRCADSVKLVDEGRDEAAWATNILFGRCILRCDLVHENSRQNRQESVGAVGSQETT